MATDIFKQVLFNDGEAVDLADFNNMQNFWHAMVRDQFLSHQIPNVGLTLSSKDPEFSSQHNQGQGFDWGAVATSRAFALNPGQAFLRPGSSTNTVQVSAGTLLQLTNATLTGDEAKFIPFTFTGNEQFTIAAGDATNPRLDLLQMKLEYVDTGSSQSRDYEDASRVKSVVTVQKTRRIQCTISVKQGTPAASPSFPEPDTGYCVIGSVGVGPTYGTGTQIGFGTSDLVSAQAHCHDQRMPFRVKAHYVDPTNFKLITAWSLQDNNSTVLASSGTNDLVVPCETGLGRIVGIGVYHATTLTGVTATLSTGIISTSIGTNKHTLSGWNSSGFDVFSFTTWENTPVTVGGYTVTQSSTTKIGLPYWTNGCRTPTEDMRNMSAPKDSKRALVRVLNASNSTKIGHVVFYVAGGL